MKHVQLRVNQNKIKQQENTWKKAEVNLKESEIYQN